MKYRKCRLAWSAAVLMMITMIAASIPTVVPVHAQDQNQEGTSDQSVSSGNTGLVTNLSAWKDADFKDAVYVAPSGTVSGTGSKESPLDLKTAIDQCVAGQAIILLDGTYEYKEQITIPYGNNGTKDAYKVLRAADGASVTLDCSSQSYTTSDLGLNAKGLQLEGDYWYISGIRVYNAADNGILVAGKHNVVERCILQGNRDTGLQISRGSSTAADKTDWPSDNLILNCTSYDNWDPKTSENADGFGAKLTCGDGNVFDGCISYCNSDDGWDLYAKPATGSIGVVTIKNCVAFHNGMLTNGNSYANGDMNGFKLGGSNGEVPTEHVVNNCMAFDNGKHGFTDNGNGAALSVSSCTSFNNQKSNFAFDRTTAGSFDNLLSYRTSGTTADKFVGTIKNSIYYAADKSLHNTGIEAVHIDSGDKLGTIIDFSAFTLKNDQSPCTDLQKIDQICRNSDGTVNMFRFLEDTGTESVKGAVFGSKAESSLDINTEKVEGTAAMGDPSQQDVKDKDTTGVSNLFWFFGILFVIFIVIITAVRLVSKKVQADRRK